MSVEQSGLEQFSFIGFLANVDSSILRVRFEGGLTIKAISYDEAFELIKMLESINDFGTFLRSTRNAWADGNNFYVLVRDFDAPPGFNAFVPLDKNTVQPLLSSFLPKLRLFKEGNIHLPLYYVFSTKDGVITPRMKAGGRDISPSPKFHLEASEIDELDDFMKSTSIPFAQPHVDLAYQSYDMSYGWMHPNLAFLLLMIGVESLLNPSKGEITYRVSRYAAVLLGDSADESASIFKEVKDLYRTRSNIVHGTSSTTVQNPELAKLRGILRGLIREVSRIDKPKDELLKMLDSLGFGERPWRKVP